MITKEELRKIVILGYLTDSMLEKLIPLVERLHLNEQDYLFKQGAPAERFFMLNRGKVLLEQRISDKMTVSIESIRPGYSIGWSGMMAGGLEPYSRYTSDAICTETSELFAINGEELNNLLDDDHDLGYMLCRRLIRVISRRLRHRTEQFVRIIKQHPDIENLIIE
ncbi:MAG: cyclic nucleotide-binding domain-containing protein [Desulfobacterales bacterium]